MNSGSDSATVVLTDVGSLPSLSLRCFVCETGGGPVQLPGVPFGFNILWSACTPRLGGSASESPEIYLEPTKMCCEHAFPYSI